VELKFKGRAVLPGAVEGYALVSRVGFNTYASFFTSIHEPSRTAVCADSGNPDLHGRDLADAIICLPGTTGSTSGGAVWQRLVRMGNAPRAMLFSRQIDPLAAGGLIIADIWEQKRIVAVDRLGEAFLEAVQSGDRIAIREDGEVLVDCSSRPGSAEVGEPSE
jgi:predicted aconitase with swiveling domain